MARPTVVVIGVLRAARQRLFRTAGLRLIEAALAKGGSFIEALGSRRSLLTRPRCWVTRRTSSNGCWPTSSAVKDLARRGNSWNEHHKSIT